MLNPGLFSFLKNYRAGSKNREICSRANQIPLSRNRQKQPHSFLVQNFRWNQITMR